MFLAPLWNISWPYIHEFISGILIVFCWFMCPFLYLYHMTLITIVLYYYLKSESVMPVGYSFFSGLLCLLGSFSISYEFQHCFIYWFFDKSISNIISLQKKKTLISQKLKFSLIVAMSCFIAISLFHFLSIYSKFPVRNYFFNNSQTTWKLLMKYAAKEYEISSKGIWPNQGWLVALRHFPEILWQK